MGSQVNSTNCLQSLLKHRTREDTFWFILWSQNYSNNKTRQTLQETTDKYFLRIEMQKTLPYPPFLLVLPSCSGLSVQEKSLHHFLTASRVERIELWRGKKNVTPLQSLYQLQKIRSPIYNSSLSFILFLESISRALIRGFWLQGVPELEEITYNILCVHTHVHFGRGKDPQLWTKYWRGVLCFLTSTKLGVGGGKYDALSWS